MVVFLFIRAHAADPTVIAGEEQKAVDYAPGVRTDGRAMGKADAEALEETLKQQPDNIVIRAKLIGYYCYRGIPNHGKVATIKTRRRHIMWLVENHPVSRLGGFPETTIDPTGHDLADLRGYGSGDDEDDQQGHQPVAREVRP